MSTQVSRAGQGRSDTHGATARPRSRRGQAPHDIQRSSAAATNSRAGHAEADAHVVRARSPIGDGAITDATPASLLPLANAPEERAGHGTRDIQSTAARPLPDLIGLLREHYRQRCDHHSAEKRLTLQIKAISRRCGAPKGSEGMSYRRWFDHTAETYAGFLGAVVLLEECRQMIQRQRQAEEKVVETLAKDLPVWPWVEQIRGVGALALGQIVAECGDLADYANPAKVWKRLGVGMFETQAGEWSRQRKAPAADGVAAGYSPRRAAVVFNVGECLIKQNQDGPYRTLYDERKLYEATKPACNAPTKTGPCNKDGHCRPGHLHNRARRYMAKRFLRELWREWNRHPADES